METLNIIISDTDMPGTEKHERKQRKITRPDIEYLVR